MSASLTRAWSDGSIGYALLWWAVLWVIGALAWSGLRRWTRGWQDAGWPVARHAGLLAAALAVWIAAHLAPAFSRASVLASVLALGAAAWWLRRRPGPGRAPARVDARVLAAAELRFAIPFALYLLMRGFNGDAVGLEKFMDFAFMNAAFHSRSMPPPDPWFSGHTVNYYYFGHYLAAFVCKLTGTPPRFGYNLMLATVFAGAFQLTWSLVAELAPAAPRVRTLAAATAAFWITMGGNLHAFLYGLVRPLLTAMGLVAAPVQQFLISDPTRFVGYDPPRPDKLITEFPAYAFYVGDLHAHLTNLPNVLLFLCATLGWLRARAAHETAVARAWLAGAAAILGLFVAANTWDAAMYGSLLAALLGWPLVGRAIPRRALAAALLDAAIAAGAAGFVAAWFLAGFQPPGSGIGATHSHTPFWQWLVLYGEQAALAVVGLALLRRRATPEAGMVLVLTAGGIGFAIVPELVYLKDIYGSDYYRGNTAFKFGFQAFLLLTLCACVAIAMLVDRMIRARWRPAVAVLALEVLLLPPLCYGWFVGSAALGAWQQREWSLDGGRHLARHAEDARIVRWLDANRRPGDALVEAVGDSYTFAARISTYSAIPAVLGWPVHELLWRRLDPEVAARREAVAALYRASGADEARAIAARYGARWIVVGETERALYPQLDEPTLRSVGPVRFEAGRSFIVEAPGGLAAAWAGR